MFFQNNNQSNNQSNNQNKNKSTFASVATGFASLVSLITFGQVSAAETPIAENLDPAPQSGRAGTSNSSDGLGSNADSGQTGDAAFADMVSSSTEGLSQLSLGATSSLGVSDDLSSLQSSVNGSSELLSEIDGIDLSDIESVNDVLAEGNFFESSSQALNAASVNTQSIGADEIDIDELLGDIDIDELLDEELDEELEEEVTDFQSESFDPPLFLQGDEMDNFLFGGSGDDQISGEGGADQIQGEQGDDVLEGNNGADILDGGLGNDVLLGGIGNDILTGGDGDDVFIFSRGDQRDVITDFVSGDDSIDLNGISLLDGFNGLLELATLDEESVVLDFGMGDQLIIMGADLSSLNEDDFVFG